MTAVYRHGFHTGQAHELWSRSLGMPASLGVDLRATARAGRALAPLLSTVKTRRTQVIRTFAVVEAESDEPPFFRCKRGSRSMHSRTGRPCCMLAVRRLVQRDEQLNRSALRRFRPRVLAKWARVACQFAPPTPAFTPPTSSLVSTPMTRELPPPRLSPCADRFTSPAGATAFRQPGRAS